LLSGGFVTFETRMDRTTTQPIKLAKVGCVIRIRSTSILTVIGFGL